MESKKTYHLEIIGLLFCENPLIIYTYIYIYIYIFFFKLETLFHKRGTETPNVKSGMEEMGGVPPTLHSHAQQVERIGVGSLTGSEIYFVCTNFSAIRTSSEKLVLQTCNEQQNENFG